MKPASSRGQHQEPTRAGMERSTVKKDAQTPTFDESRTLMPPPSAVAPPLLVRTGEPVSSSTPHVAHSSSASVSEPP